MQELFSRELIEKQSLGVNVIEAPPVCIAVKLMAFNNMGIWAEKGVLRQWPAFTLT